MAAIVQAALCASIFFMIGLRYRPFPDSRYKLSVSIMAWAACAITGMQCVSLVGRMVIEHDFADASWFNTAFYFLASVLVFRAKGNVARIIRVE
ncbi:phage holin family protein [Pseudomonas sp. C1C7]|uniref:phage holin family protein n=1 Tax=Pseudomonas sp. C1C7 TaxID=2735272 RepID=UPI001586B134|nr:phage holin family protein [Pseudomonas sp. C1C7]NUT73541.1 phage holin family protein [Pseudomonas sp. C1C7]